MESKELVDRDLERVQDILARYKANGTNNSLMKASFRGFLCDIMLQFLGGIVSILLNFLSPFVVLRLINFIEDGVQKQELTWESVRPGVILSSILVGTQLASQFIQQHIQYNQVMTGVRSTNAVIAMIYLKHAQISNATNKQFESGQIVNFVQVDAERLFWICFQLSEIVQVPFVLGLSFAFSFYYFGWMFCAGLGVFLIAIVFNLAIGLYYNKNEKIVMRRKGRRMKVTTESINNMKMLKLYSW